MSQPRGPESQPAYGSSPREAKAQASAEKAYRKAQRPWYKKKRFIGPLAIVLLIVIISVSTSGGAGTSPAPGGSAAQDQNAPPAFPGATSDDVVVQAGEAVDASGVSVTTSALEEGDSTLGETLCTTVGYTNGGDSAARFSLIDWKLQDPNGTILNTGLLGSDNPLSTGEIAPGGNASGDVCFDAPQGNPSGQYVVVLDPPISFSSERFAWLNTR